MGEPVVVADASVLVKWYIPEVWSEQAVMLRDDHIKGCVRVVAPSYAMVEFCSALRKYVARRFLSREQALKAFSLLVKTRVGFMDVAAELARGSLEYSMESGVTVYDAYYIVLAKHLKTAMYTADEKLLAKLQGRETVVKHVREYPEDRVELLKSFRNS